MRAFIKREELSPLFLDHDVKVIVAAFDIGIINLTIIPCLYQF